jgi:transcriptional regulator with XRE-family HTH domain
MSKFPNIRALRIQNGYKQEFIADLLGISQPEYSKIEGGMRRIDAFTINELCKLYDVKVDVLMRSAPVQVITEVSAVGDQRRAVYAAAMPPDLLGKIMDNYSALMENYLKQQQTTERILEHLMGNAGITRGV